MALKDKLLSSANYKLDWIPTHKPTTPKKEKPTMKKPQTRLTQAERFAVMKLLEKFIVKGDDGFVSYSDNMSDFKIAQMVGPNIPNTSVGYTRIQLYGRLRDQHPPKTAPSSDKLATLGNRIEAHNTRIIAIERMLLRLATELGVDLSKWE